MNQIIHPALWKLMKMRSQGRVRSLLANFSHPRKLFVSILGAFLALVWLGNAIVSLLFRERYNPEGFQTTVTLMLTLYALWHVVRVSWQRPETSMEWSEAEQNNLVASPFTRRQLVQYRLATVLTATTLKAAIGTLLLLPDLDVPLLGFAGLWLGLGMIEFIRLICDTAVVGMSERTYQAYRSVVVVALVSLATQVCLTASAMTANIPAAKISTASETPVFFEFIKNFYTVLQDSLSSSLGALVAAPFTVFVDILTASKVDVQSFVSLGIGVLMVLGGMFLLLRLDQWSNRARIAREKDPQRLNRALQLEDVREDLRGWKLSTRWISWCGGAVIWRQLVGIYRYRSGAILALIPPAILAAMPLFMPQLDRSTAILNFLGGLAFYSFLLLPSAMKFDFRRDYNHLMLLKMLPMSSSRVVFGQLATPIIVTTLFQYVMIGIACAVRGMSPATFWAAMFSFPAMNLAVYGWENLMFLIFPQKMKQEGIEVFLRTTVIFTAKGLAFAFAFVFLFLWAIAARDLASDLGRVLPVLSDHRVLFGSGVWITTMSIGVIMVRLAARRFELLDAFPEMSG